MARVYTLVGDSLSDLLGEGLLLALAVLVGEVSLAEALLLPDLISMLWATLAAGDILLGLWVGLLNITKQHDIKTVYKREFILNYSALYTHWACQTNSHRISKYKTNHKVATRYWY